LDFFVIPWENVLVLSSLRAKFLYGRSGQTGRSSDEVRRPHLWDKALRFLFRVVAPELGEVKPAGHRIVDVLLNVGDCGKGKTRGILLWKSSDAGKTKSRHVI
jgi:hypothetical protein